MQTSDDDLEEYCSESEEEEARRAFYCAEDAYRTNTKAASTLFQFNLFSMCGIAVKCCHNNMPVAVMHSPLKVPGMWLPYIALRKNFEQSIMNALISVFFYRENGQTKDWKTLYSKPEHCLLERLTLHNLTRVQMPHGRFFDRAIFIGRFKDSSLCCKDTEHIRWLPCDKAATHVPKFTNAGETNLQLIVNQFWGYEVPYYASLLLQSVPTLCLQLREVTITNDFRLHHRESDENTKYLMRIFTHSKLSRIFSDFFQHCYPSITMSFQSFQNYFAKIGLVYDEKKMSRFFCAFSTDETPYYLTLIDFAMGLAIMEPIPENNGQNRIGYIWRYYKASLRKDPLEGEDLKLFRSDLQAAVTTKLEVLQDITKPLSYQDFLNMLQNKDYEQGLLRLFQLDQSVYSLIVEKAPYSVTLNRYGLAYRKELLLACDRCKPKQYTIARNVIQFREYKGNKISAIPTKSGETLIISPGRPKSFELMLKLSNEIVFKTTSSANIVLNAIRQLYGLVSMSPERRKTTIQIVNNEITFEHIARICEEVQDILLSEPRVLKVSAPCYVLGDIHGNIDDLLTYDRLFWPTAPTVMPANVLFLGDFVDRGDFSLEVVFYLFSIKLLAPNRFFFLRGNHEVRAVQKTFTFERECNEKFGVNGQCVFDLINQTFDSFPFAALLNERIFCAHGGIPQAASTVQELNNFSNLVSDPRSETPIWEILWNDPVSQEQFDELPGFAKGSKEEKTGFFLNYRRGTALFWGPNATKNYLAHNNLTHIIRAHEMEEQGYKLLHDGRVITIFSCSKYCHGANRSVVLLIEPLPDTTKGLIRIFQVQT